MFCCSRLASTNNSIFSSVLVKRMLVPSLLFTLVTMSSISSITATTRHVEKLTLDNNSEDRMLFDFTKMSSLDGWEEQSDSVREVGKSKAVLVLQKTRVFQRAVFFSVLNPQPNGACFAGYRTETSLDLSPYGAIELWLRGQGQNYGYKVNLRHHGLNDEPHPTYEHMFHAPKNEFGLVRLDLSDFEPYYRGRKLNVSEVGPLDKSDITNVEIQIYGGVYLPTKQSGTSSLEIDWIKAVPVKKS